MADLVPAGEERLSRIRSEEQAPRELLAFSLAGELYGIELVRIREILSPPPLTPVPRASRDVLGVCSVRGLLVTVVDLRLRLKLEPASPTRRTRILLTRTDRGEVLGLLVDEVHQVVRFPHAEIEVAANVLGGDVSEHVLGIARPGDTLIILLDLASIVGG